MSSYDKVVKLACKPKSAPPKAKYLEPIIAATWSDDGAVHDVCKALSPRFREPNSVVVFKALIVLHTMIRNGSTDNVLGYLSSSEVLRLRNVSNGNWDGYAAPENIQHYATYLDSRIRAYRDLKHDAIRVQSETNRDMRNSVMIEEDLSRTTKKGKSSLAPPSGGMSRSKTIVGRKLRSMTVEKGLLRETKAVHRMIDTLVECRFYMDDLEDELSIMALRMLVKDLLILFQAGNEGVINLLEHYFEMSKVDAKDALDIYRHFCKQTERVVEYLGVAKKLQNLLNVPIPNLKHAPVSLAGALQEYLDDPNFEQNRIEYKANKDAADRGGAATTPAKKAEPVTPSKKPETNGGGATSSTAATSSAPAASKDVLDFFAAIEQEQPTMFNPQTNSPTTAHFHAQSAANPFAQMQMTGQPFLNVQQTGFIQPQHTIVPNSTSTNPFNLQHQATGQPSFASFMQQQQTGMPGLNAPSPTGLQAPNSAPANGQQSFLAPQQANFLRPQATGANPFRQSMLFPQATGMFQPQATGQQQQNGVSNPFPNMNMQPTGMQPSGPFGSSSTSAGFPSTFTPGAQAQSQNTKVSGPNDLPARPSSTPLTGLGNKASPPEAQPVKRHQTGTKNPFGPVSTTPPPPMPTKQPTLFELSMGLGSSQNQNQPQQQQQQQQTQQSTLFGAPAAQPQQPQQTGFGGFNFSSGALSVGSTDMGSIASSFSSTKPNGTTGALNARPSSPPANAAGSAASSAFSPGSSLFGTSTGSSQASSSLFGTNPTGSSQASSLFGTNPTGSSQTSSTPSINVSPAGALQPQKTGFSGLKPFKPTSAFGASLMENLPTISEPSSGSTPSSTNPTGTTSAPAPGSGAFGGSAPFSSSTPFTSSLSSTTTGLGSMNLNGNTTGVGLRPQMTGGAGAANPFRASMAGGGLNAFGGAGAQSTPPVPGLPSFMTGNSPFNLGGGAFGSGLGGAAGQTGQQQQQQQSTSLI